MTGERPRERTGLQRRPTKRVSHASVNPKPLFITTTFFTTTRQ